MGFNKHRMTRIAFPFNKFGEVNYDGLQRFKVPASHYPELVDDFETRDFTLLASDLVERTEPAWLTYSTAIYCNAEVAVRAGVMGIANPKLNATRRRTFNNKLR